MEIFCKVSVVSPDGYHYKRFSRGSAVLGGTSKKPVIIVRKSPVSTAGTKFNLLGNIDNLFIESLYKGQLMISLKQPSCNIFISKANRVRLSTFTSLILVHLMKHASEYNLPPISAYKPPIAYIKVYCQEEYNRRMKRIVKRNLSLNFVKRLIIINCALELVPVAVRKMKRLTFLRLNDGDLCSSSILKIESRMLKKIYVIRCKTPLSISSLFKNDLCYKDSLVELFLEANRWSEVPNGIFQFRNLLRLSLSNNCLTELPDKFTNLSQLQVLDLSQNHFTRVPPSVFALYNLSQFSLSENLITQLPDMFTNLSKLKVLSLAWNKLQYLPPSICCLHLQGLDIGFNEFNFEIAPSVGSEPIVHSLKELSYRTILKHKLNVEEGKLPQKFLKDLHNYQQCICGCKFVDEGQDLVFLFNLSKITKNFLEGSFPIRGSVCNSMSSCTGHLLTPRVSILFENH